MSGAATVQKVLLQVFGGKVLQAKGTASAKLLGYICTGRDTGIGIEIEIELGTI